MNEGLDPDQPSGAAREHASEAGSSDGTLVSRGSELSEEASDVAIDDIFGPIDDPAYNTQGSKGIRLYRPSSGGPLG